MVNSQAIYKAGQQIIYPCGKVEHLTRGWCDYVTFYDHAPQWACNYPYKLSKAIKKKLDKMALSNYLALTK